MFVERQRRSGRPFQQAGQFAGILVLVENLDLNTFELRWAPFHVLRLDIDRTADRGFKMAVEALFKARGFPVRHDAFPLMFCSSFAGSPATPRGADSRCKQKKQPAAS